MSFRIFVSHKVDRDRDIATKLSDKLRILSHSKIEVIICEKTPGGNDWQRWIDDNVKKCDVLLYLHTGDADDFQWCWYEVGIFKGARDSTNNLVCIKHPALKNPAHLSRYQSYDATEEGLRRFFKEAIKDGTFSDNESFNDKLLDDDVNELKSTVKELVELFEARQEITDYFHKRLEIGPLPENPKAPDQSLQDALIAANDFTKQLLQLPNVPLKWKEISKQFKERGDAWVTDLEECVQAIREKRYPKQVMTPFQSVSGRICYPVLARVNRIRNSPVLLVVAFVEGVPSEALNEHATTLARAPEPLNTLVALLNMARRFRWNVLSPFHASLSAHIDNENDVKEILAELDQAVSRLMNEADENYFLQPQYLKAVFGPGSSDDINKLFDDYYKIFGQLKKGIKDTDRQSVMNCLKDLMPLNKKFLLMAIDEYRQYIEDKVEPI